MRIYDKNHKIISEQEADLNKGYLGKYITIKPEAEPLSNTKTVWNDEDWEEALIYLLFEDLPIPQKREQPTQLDRIESQVTYTAMMTNTLQEG